MSVRDRILKAYALGYYFDVVGNIFNRDGLQLKLQKELKKNIPYLYFGVGSGSSGTRGKVPVHRFIGYYKYGNNLFQPKLGIRHLNGNSLDNSFSNLEIGTQSQNMLDRDPQARLDHATFAAQALRKVDPREVQRLKDSGLRNIDIARKLGVVKSTITYTLQKTKGMVNCLQNNVLEGSSPSCSSI